jgi:hypothetical protein
VPDQAPSRARFGSTPLQKILIVYVLLSTAALGIVALVDGSGMTPGDVDERQIPPEARIGPELNEPAPFFVKWVIVQTIGVTALGLAAIVKDAIAPSERRSA